MWAKLSHRLLQYRCTVLCILASITVFMAYMAQKVEISHTFTQVVPHNDPDKVYFHQFQQRFGTDNNLLVLGLQDNDLYQVANFEQFTLLTHCLAKLSGIKEVIALPQLQKLNKNTATQSFYTQPIFKPTPHTQQALDSALVVFRKIKLYEHLITNPTQQATLLFLVVDKSLLDSSQRHGLITQVQQAGTLFTQATGIPVHYSGIPYIRDTIASKVKTEMQLFLGLSIIVTAIALLLFFRSWLTMLFAMLGIVIMVVWSIGIMALLGYKITLLTALLPPIIVVIGVPNSIYLINMYHREYALQPNKIQALTTVVHNIGLATFMTNFTTAVGFLVLAFTNIVVLQEFGLVVAINIMALFLVSIIFIPIIFSLLPAPDTRHLKSHLFNGLMHRLTHVVASYPTAIFITVVTFLCMAGIGMAKLQAVSYMADDMPPKSQVIRDLQFFETNFGGIMPLDIIIDTGKKKGVQNWALLKKIDKLQTFLAKQPHIAQPISSINFLKAARQAYYQDNPAYYSLPTSLDRAFILRYFQGTQNHLAACAQNFVDSTGQHLHLSLKVADIGSKKLYKLIENVIQPKIHELFDHQNIPVHLTGSTLLFLKGNLFLIKNLLNSLILAIFLIASIMALLFGNLRIIVIAIIANLIPLCLTAGLMGYLGILLKPSTAIIFSIVFGIAVDDAIHFLTKYRSALKNNPTSVPMAVKNSLQETGLSMIYTSMVLFAGFVVFTASEFQGTVALGMLTSMTLLFAMFTNLMLLPALLLRFDTGKHMLQTNTGHSHIKNITNKI